MTTRIASITVAIGASMIVWTIFAWMVMADSRQTCEETTSIETCTWELK